MQRDYGMPVDDEAARVATGERVGVLTGLDG